MSDQRATCPARARKFIRFQTRLAVAFSLLAVLISSLLVFALYLQFRGELREDLRDRLRDVVSVAALSLDGDAHATLTDPNQENSPVYLQIKRTLQQIRDRAKDIRFAYTWRTNSQGQLIFVVDAETDPNEISHLGDVYDSAEPAVLARIAQVRSVQVDEEPTSDKWGIWLSGYAPFYRSDGRIEGILGMDISATQVVANERRFLWEALAVVTAIVLLAVVLGRRWGRRLAAPIVELTRGAERITQGDLGHRVDVRGRDEAFLLAQSFNSMTQTLHQAILRRDAEIASRTRAENSLQVLNVDLQASVQRLGRANEELRRFAFATAHDLKTPLRGIHMLVDWMVAEYQDQLDERGREYLALLATRTSRVCRSVEAIHQYVSIGYQESRGTIDLNELVPELVNSLHVPDRVQVLVDGPLPVVQYDKDRIRQVFLNLVDNAIKYMDKPQGRIVIRAVEEPACWRLSVEDNGPGIEEKYDARIFEVFQTLAVKDKSDAVGMGLSVVKKIIESYGGRIWLESVVGEGTTFFFTLPRQSPVQWEPLAVGAADSLQ